MKQIGMQTQRCSVSALLPRRLAQGVWLCMLLVVPGCGSEGSNGSSASNELNPSGSASFAIQLQPLQRQEVIPKGGISCADTRITKILIKVIDNLTLEPILGQDGQPLQGVFNCDAHAGRLEGISVGGDRILTMGGIASSNGLVLYEGASKSFNIVSPGENKDVGVVPISPNINQLNAVPLKLDIGPPTIKVKDKATVKLAFQDKNGKDVQGSPALSEFDFIFNKDIVSINGETLTGLAVGETEVTGKFGAGDHQITSNKVKVIVAKPDPSFDFTLNVNTLPGSPVAPLKVNRGESVQYRVGAQLIKSVPGLQPKVEFSVPQCLGGEATCSFDPTSITLNDPNNSLPFSTLTVKTSLLKGNADFTIQGVGSQGSERVTSSTPVKLDVVVPNVGTVKGFIDGGAGSTVTAAGKSATVDSFGFFTLTEVPVGTQNVTVNAGEAGTFTRTTIVQQGETSDIGPINPVSSPKTISKPVNFKVF